MKDFIPYEQSLDLKELGFDEPCFGFWDGYNGDSHLFFKPRVKYHWIVRLFSKTPNMISYTQGMLEYIEGEGSVLAPTYSQAFRWFRENHNLVYQINYLYNGNYQVVILKNTHEYMELIQDLEHACVDEIPDNYSYEEAELACLIKLIEIVKTK
jgi:hypothetical protein